MNEKEIAFQGEMMLVRWNETHNGGMTVMFQVHSEDGIHPFKEFTTKAGKQSGQRFMGVLVQINDDETAVERTPSQLAYLLCKDPEFWEWANDRSFVEVTSEATARDYVLSVCKVDSRSKIDRDPYARSAWDRAIWAPFNAARAKSREPRL